MHFLLQDWTTVILYYTCCGEVLLAALVRARAVNCEGPIVPEGVIIIIRARAVNCEGPIVPKGVIRV